MNARPLCTPTEAAQEYDRWLEACGGVDAALDGLRDDLASALPDEALAPLLERIEVIEALMAKQGEHVENVAKSLAAALVQRKRG